MLKLHSDNTPTFLDAPPGSQMNVRLVIEQAGRRRVMNLRPPQAVIGRAHGNTVRVPSSDVSRQHCRLLITEGMVMVEDMNSINGTFLNGRQIDCAECVRPGDHLGVGPVTFLVEFELSDSALAQLGPPPEVEPVAHLEVMEEAGDDLPVMEEVLDDIPMLEFVEDDVPVLEAADESDLAPRSPANEADELILTDFDFDPIGNPGGERPTERPTERQPPRPRP
jgi:predicted component of type VI protein secretion system